MRIAIREQLAALVILAVLVSLAVVSIPTWIFVNKFVVDIESKNIALTASLKASQIDSELQLFQTTHQTVATRKSLQNALLNYYSQGTEPSNLECEDETLSRDDVWCAVENDVGRALSNSKYTSLIQARIYLNNTNEEYDNNGIFNINSQEAIELFNSPDKEATKTGNTIKCFEDNDNILENNYCYLQDLYPAMSFFDDKWEELVKNETSGEEKLVTVEQTVAEPFNGVYINDTLGNLVLGPVTWNNTFSYISMTGPIYNGNDSAPADVLGYLTLVMRFLTFQDKWEGLDKTGVVLVIGPTTPYNRFTENNFTSEIVDDEPILKDNAMARFMLPPTNPNDTTAQNRHFTRTNTLEDASKPFELKKYPAALDSLNTVTKTPSSLLSTYNEQDFDVAVGCARPQSQIVRWTVVVEKARQEAYVPVMTLKHILLACVFGTAGVSLLLVYPAAHRFVMPIRRLKHATEQSIAPPGYDESFDSDDFDTGTVPGSGTRSHKSRHGFLSNIKLMIRKRRRRNSTGFEDRDLGRRVFKIPARVDDRKHFLKDELTELTCTFNEMSDELEKQYTQLDQKVAERTKELEISKKAAEAANESKTLFIANISHELKTPLNGIMGMTSICLDETDITKIHESLRIIYKSGDLLLHLLTDLLNFSKNQIGQQLSLDQNEFRLNDIRQQVMVIFDKQVRENDIDFQVSFLSSEEEPTPILEHPSAHLPALGPPGTGRLRDMCLWGDQHRILQVMINLVSNSLKFTPKGGRVDCRIKCLGEVEAHGDVSRHSSTSRHAKSGNPRRRHGSASVTSSSTPQADGTRIPLQEGTAVLINPVEPKVAPPVAPIRERSPSPPPRSTKTYLFEFEVQDTGPGIAEHMQSKVFEPFVQGDLGLSRKFGGTGLGLSICQQLATLMGGSITLSSTVGVGTTFTMRIPLRYIRDRPPSVASSVAPSIYKQISIDKPPSRDSSPSPTKPAGDTKPTGSLSTKPRLVGLSQPFFANTDPSPASAKDDPISRAMDTTPTPKPPSDDKGLRILIADDNRINVQVLSGFLKRDLKIGELVIVTDGIQAVNTVKNSGAFDLIMMDVQMPEMDGIESAKEIRKFGCRTPIVALTAFTDPINRQRCLNAGMDYFMGKPLTRNKLKDMTRKVVPITEEDEHQRPGSSRKTTQEKVPQVQASEVDEKSDPSIIVGQREEVQTPEGGRTSSHSSHTIVTPSEGTGQDIHTSPATDMVALKKNTSRPATPNRIIVETPGSTVPSLLSTPTPGDGSSTLMATP